MYAKMNAFMSLTTVVEDEPGGPVYPFVSLSPDRIPVNTDHKTVAAKTDVFKLIP